MKKHLTSIVLVVLAAAMAIWVAVDWGKTSTGEQEERKRSLVVAWRPDEITELTIDNASGEAKLVRGAADDKGQRAWSIAIGGATYAADEQTVDQLLGALQYATFDHEVKGKDKKEMGLDRPRGTIEIAMGSERFRVAIGGESPKPSKGAYAEATSRGAVAVSGELAKSLLPLIDDLREKKLSPYVSTELSKIAIDGDGGAKHFTRAAWSGSRGAGFRFDGTTPEGTVRVDADALDRAWLALGELTAGAFLSDAEADKSLAKALTITTTPMDGRPRATIEIGGACPKREGYVVAIRREPSRVSACVAKEALAALEAPASDFVDVRAFSAPEDEVTDLVVGGDGGPIDMARAGTGWHLRKPRDAKLDQEVGGAVLDRLLGARGKIASAEDAREIDGAKPLRTIAITSLSAMSSADGGADREEKCEVFGRKDGGAIVKRLEDGALLALDADAAKMLAVSEHALRPRRVFDEDLKNVRGLSLERAGVVQKLERTDSGGFHWLAPKGDGLEADVGLATDLAELITTLEAERWAAEPDHGQYGLDKPREIVDVELEGKKLHLAIGAPTSDGAYARAGDDPGVFVVGKVVEAAADRWLLDRNALDVEASKMTRATISSGATKVVLEKRGDAFHLAPHDDAARATAIRDSLTDLLAEGAVSIGPPEKSQGFDRPAAEVTVERGADPSKKIVLSIGAGDSFRGMAVRYVRRSGVDATYAVASSKLSGLLDAIGK